MWLAQIGCITNIKISKMDEVIMTREELLRVLSFAGTLRKLSEEKTDLASVDARWNI
ncbi:MAG: hypothetical protein ACI901_002011, partial [Octadecabacter sp.]